MKLLVFGIGDCGSRLAGEFSELNRKAKLERRVQIIANAYAINNDRSGLAQLKARCRELQTIFVNRTLEEQSAKSGAEIMRVEGGRVLTAIRPGDFYDTDAILVIAGAAGNFGSGGTPVIAQLLKDRHVGKPIYALVVLSSGSEASEPIGASQEVDDLEELRLGLIAACDVAERDSVALVGVDAGSILPERQRRIDDTRRLGLARKDQDHRRNPQSGQ